MWVVSCPCPPWSRAGAQSGFESESGRLWLEVFEAAHFCKPFMIAAENVSTITEHSDFQLIRGLAVWAGYRFLWEDVAPLQDLAPVTRPRWLALFGRHIGEDEELISYRWLELGHPNLATFDAWHLTFDEEHRRSLELSDAAIDVYNNPRFLPVSMCRRRRRNDIRARAIRSNDKLGTIMAAQRMASRMRQFCLQICAKPSSR